MAYPGEIIQVVKAQGGSASLKPYQEEVTNAPTANDKAIGGRIVYTSGGAVYMMTDPSSGQWTNLSGGSGSFSSLTVNGTTTLNGALTVAPDAGEDIDIGINATDKDVSIGSETGSSQMALSWGTGGILAQGAPSGPMTVGSVDATGTFTLGRSTAGQDINIGSGVNAAAQVISIANGASADDSTVNILSGVGTAGAGVLNLANNTRVTTVDIGDIAPAAARTFNIAGGDQAQDDTVNILAGAPSANTQTFNVLTGVATGGTQNANIATGGGAVKTVHIGNNVATSSVRLNTAPNEGFEIADGTVTPPRIIVGSSLDPGADAVTAPQGSLYLSTAGGTGATIWVKFGGADANWQSAAT